MASGNFLKMAPKPLEASTCARTWDSGVEEESNEQGGVGVG